MPLYSVKAKNLTERYVLTTHRSKVLFLVHYPVALRPTLVATIVDLGRNGKGAK